MDIGDVRASSPLIGIDVADRNCELSRLCENAIAWKSSTVGSSSSLPLPSQCLPDVFHWLLGIHARSKCTPETRDCAFLLFIEYLSKRMTRDPHAQLDDVATLSKIAAVCMVLGAKMHESKRRVRLQSFTFVRTEELVALEVEILNLVGLSPLYVAPSVLVREMLLAMVPNKALALEAYALASGKWMETIIMHSVIVWAAPPTVAVVAIVLALQHHMEMESGKGVCVPHSQNAYAEALDMFLSAVPRSMWLPELPGKQAQFLGADKALACLASNVADPQDRALIQRASAYFHRCMVQAHLPVAAAGGGLGSEPITFSAAPPSERELSVSATGLFGTGQGQGQGCRGSDDGRSELSQTPSPTSVAEPSPPHPTAAALKH